MICHCPQEILFLKETNENIAIWEGHKYTKDEAFEASGIRTVYWLSQFDNVFNTLMAQAKHVYLNTNEHIRAVIEVETRDASGSKHADDLGDILRRRRPLVRQERPGRPSDSLTSCPCP